MHVLSGPDLKTPTTQHSMLTYSNDVIVIGGIKKTDGQLDTLQKISCTNGNCVCSQMEQKLSKGKSGIVAIYMPKVCVQ